MLPDPPMNAYTQFRGHPWNLHQSHKWGRRAPLVTNWPRKRFAAPIAETYMSPPATVHYFVQHDPDIALAHPSLTIADGDSALLYTCHAGCEPCRLVDRLKRAGSRALSR